ncbi:MAG: Radical SAM superfamily protein [Syntrophorhabdus sp. PtaB.Bin047]|nr:MAG: Radical SAM superfamily protein [Syntrophorhabdus sp. PtaB.Bin047]
MSERKNVLLINPPVAKPCEPPAGLARLAGALKDAGHPSRVLDMNLEGMLRLFSGAVPGDDRWSQRAARNLSRNLDALRDERTYRNFDRYKRCVNDVNRLFAFVGGEDTRISLCDYEDRRLSPLRSEDLLEAARHPEDSPFYDHFAERLREELERGDGVAGFSLTYLSQALAAFAMMGFVRNEFPGVKIILGGGLVTSWMSAAAWENGFGGLVDHVVAGPGEGFLLELLGSPPKAGGRSISASYAYDTFPLKDYLSPGMVMPCSTSTGCYYGKCSFCPETAEGTGYLQLAPAEAAAGIAGLAARYRPSLIHIVDNAVSPSVLKGLVNDPPGVPWYGFARVTKELTDRGFCEGLKRSGCVMLKLGVESGDQDVLDGMRKGISVADVSKALKALARAGIGTYVYLLFGTPGEDEEAARKTMDFVVEHHEFIGFVNLAVFNLPHSSPDAAAVEAKPFYGGDLSFYTDFVHPKGWDRRKVRRFIDREFTRHPAIREIVKRQPPYFTSNHAPFFVDAFC